MYTLVYLDHERRLKVYPEGGCQRERLVPGIGWVLADDEDWDDDHWLARVEAEFERRPQCLLPDPEGGPL